MRGFCAQLYEAFCRVNGYGIGVLGTVVTLATFAYTPDTTISMKILVPVAFALTLVILTLLDCAWGCCRRLANPLPNTRRAIAPSRLCSNSIAILLVEPNSLMSYGLCVSIYFRENDSEILIGIGSVFTIQTNGLVQVSAEDILDGKSTEVWKKILNNNKDAIASLVVRPSIPTQLLA